MSYGTPGKSQTIKYELKSSGIFFWRKAECLNLIICFLLEYVHFTILNYRQILENSSVWKCHAEETHLNGGK